MSNKSQCVIQLVEKMRVYEERRNNRYTSLMDKRIYGLNFAIDAVKQALKYILKKQSKIIDLRKLE